MGSILIKDTTRKEREQKMTKNSPMDELLKDADVLITALRMLLNR